MSPGREGKGNKVHLQEQNSRIRAANAGCSVRKKNKRKSINAHESRTEHCGMIYNSIIDIADLWQQELLRRTAMVCFELKHYSGINISLLV